MSKSFYLNENQQAVAEFMEASRELRSVAADPNFPELSGFTDRFLSAVTHFGRTEMEVLRRDRVMDMTERGFTPVGLGDINEVRSRLMSRFNNSGIDLLDRADPLSHAATRVDLPDRRPAMAADVTALREELHFHLGELEIKPGDARRIAESIRPVLDFASEGDITGLYGYVDDQTARLRDSRSSRSRGTEENIPVWKVAAIAIAVGVWVWGLFRCRWWGSCSLKEGLAYFIVFWISTLIARYC